MVVDSWAPGIVDDTDSLEGAGFAPKHVQEYRGFHCVEDARARSQLVDEPLDLPPIVERSRSLRWEGKSQSRNIQRVDMSTDGTLRLFDESRQHKIVGGDGAVTEERRQQGFVHWEELKMEAVELKDEELHLCAGLVRETGESS